MPSFYSIGTQRLERLRHLIDVAGVGILLLYHREEVVRLVGWHGHSHIGLPVCVVEVVVLTEVGEAHKVARLLILPTLVGDPHLDARNVDTGGYEGELGSEAVVVGVEVLREEEVPVLVVLVGVY